MAGSVIPVKYVRGEVDTVGPGDRSRYLVYGDPAEEVRIGEWFEDAALKDPVEVELAHESVGERQAEAVLPQVLHFENSGRAAHEITLAKAASNAAAARSLMPSMTCW